MTEDYYWIGAEESIGVFISREYLLTNWLAYLYGRIQSPSPDVMPDERTMYKKGLRTINKENTREMECFARIEILVRQ